MSPIAVASTVLALAVPGIAQQAPSTRAPGDGPVDVRTLPQAPFERAHVMLPEPFLYERILTGDVDGDGDVDLVGEDLRVNDGTARFTPGGKTRTPDPVPASYLALVDMDLDGLQDLVGFEAGAAYVRLNTGGKPPFDAPVLHPLPADPGFPHMVVGDVSGDGAPDLVVAGGFSLLATPDVVLLNVGSGMVAESPASLPAGTRTFAPHLVDLDGDGDLDLVANTGARTLSLLLNDGAGTFASAPPPVVDPGGRTVVLDPGDVDSDGLVDLLADLGTSIELLRNVGGASFSATGPVLPARDVQYHTVILDDFTGDGAPDALFERREYTGLELYVNDGTGSFGFLPDAVPRFFLSSGALRAADLDGDDDLDVVLGAWSLLLNDGHGRLEEVTHDGWEPDYFWGGLAAGRFDDDPFPDLVRAMDDGSVVLLLGDGTGDFTGVVTALGPWDAPKLAAADVNGDEYDDLLVCWRHGIELYVNDGAGQFTDRTEDLPAPVQSFRRITTGDVDGDGDPDLLLYSGLLELWLNDGGGVFTDATSSVGLDIGAGAAGFAHLDRDGHLDIWATGPQGLVAYLNDRTGPFVRRFSVLAFPGSPVTGAAADIDGDGVDDVLVNMLYDCHWSCNRRHRLYRNDGTGSFTEAPVDAWPEQFNAYYDALLVPLDANGDGHVDVLSEYHELWLNDGAGALVAATRSMPPENGGAPNGLATADFDLDGDMDAVIQGRLLVNVSTHLAWLARPRVGKPLSLEISGPPLTRWSLIAGETRIAPLATERGLLHIDPASATKVARGVLDRSGRATFTTSVPADAALVGRSLYWQAIVGAPERFTKLERTTFSDL